MKSKIKAVCSIDKKNFHESLTLDILNFMPFWIQSDEFVNKTIASNLYANNRANFSKLFGKYCFFVSDSAGRRLYVWELSFESETFFALTSTDSGERGTSYEYLAQSLSDKNDKAKANIVRDFMREMMSLLDQVNSGSLQTFEEFENT